jgi:GT2 family glycosyltransferase
VAKVKYQDEHISLPKDHMPGKIGVVTVTYNSGEVLPDFLQSLYAQTHSNYVLYAIDNASRDSTLEQLRQWGDARLVLIPNEHNVGVAAGNNQGIRAAIQDGCEFVLLLNNDVVFGPDLFKQLMDGLTEHNCQMITPLIYYYEPKDMIWCAGGHFQPWLANRTQHYGDTLLDSGQFYKARPVNYVPTCCVLMRREVFLVAGLMDERYFVYSDDVDFMLRAKNTGQILYYLPTARLWHKVNALTGTLSEFSIFYGTRNRALFLRKHYGRPVVMLFTLIYKSYYTARLLLAKDSPQIFSLKRKAWSKGLNQAEHVDFIPR